MTVRQQLVDDVKVRMEGISKSAGYETDLGKRVFVCRPVDVTESEATQGVLNIWDLKETHKAIMNRVHEHTLEFHLMTLFAGPNAATVCRAMFGDIAKAIGKDVRWGGLACDTEPAVDECEINQENRTSASGRFVFKIIYQTRAWDWSSAA